MLTVFGPGVLMLARTDVANSTPVNIGKVNEFSVDFAFTEKELFGQYQFPLAVARGTSKVTGKAKAAALSGLMIADVFFGDTPTTGQKLMAINEAGTIPGTPYAVTVTNSATFVDDLGVVFTATGLPLTKVASGPTTGQYSVSAGVYTFAAADTTLAVLITYTYTTTGGQKFTISNNLLGESPVFQLTYQTSYADVVPFFLQFNRCISTKLAMAFKLEDFMMPEVDFSIFADASNNIGTASFGEIS